MKSAILSIVAVAFGSALALAQTDFEVAMNSVLEDLRPGHSLRFEEDISQQCKDEVAELNKNSDFLIAYNGLSSCSPVSDGRTSIKIDYNRCSSAGKVQLACTSAGGKYGTASFTIVCSANGEKVSVSAIDIPECTGKSCDASLGDPEAKNELANAFEQGLQAGGVPATCVSPASAIGFSKIAMAGGMLGLLINLL